MRLERIIDLVARDLERGRGIGLAIGVGAVTAVILTAVAVLLMTPLPTGQDASAREVSLWEIVTGERSFPPKR